MPTVATAGPHFFVEPEDVDGGVAILRGDEARHLAVVLRTRAGDPISLADGSGRLLQGRIERAAPDEVRARVVAEHLVPAVRPRTTVVHALPKQRKLDDVVQRLTELGVDRIVPVSSARSQVELVGPKAERAVARWRAVAHAAAKQSRRARLPEIAAVGTWATAFPPGTAGFVAWEGSDVALRAVLDVLVAPDEIVVGVGPEGGLTEEEVAATGVPHASLGGTVLRTETAALVAVAAVRYHLGLLA